MKKISLVLILCSLALIIKAETQSQFLSNARDAFEQEEYLEVVRGLTKALAQEEVSEMHWVQVHFLLGNAYYEVGKHPRWTRRYPDAWERAYTHLSTVKDIDHGSFHDQAQNTLTFLAPYLYNKGISAYNEGVFELAARYLWKVRQIHPNDPQTWLTTGYALWKMGKQNEAIAAWGNASRANKPSPYLTISTPIVQQQAIGELKKRQAYLPERVETPALATFPAPFQWKPEEVTLIQSRSMKAAEAMQFLMQNLEQFPEDIKAREAYAALLWKDSRMAAIDQYQTILKSDEHHIVAHTCLAQFYLDKAYALYQINQEGFDKARREGRYIPPFEWLSKATPHLQVLAENGAENGEKYLTMVNACLNGQKWTTP